MNVRVTIGLVAAATLATAVVGAQEIRVAQTIDALTARPGVAGGLQPMDPGTGIIYGQVVESDGRTAVAGAIATLNLPGAGPIRVMTDAEGHFAFRDLPKGRFNVTASKPGYADGSFGRLRPSGPTLGIDLAEGGRVSDATIRIFKYASVSGTVLDEAGEPLVGATVRVLRKSLIGGKRQLTEGARDTTDDRGIYRIGGLETGDYVVVVPIVQNANPFGDLGLNLRDFAPPGGAAGGAVQFRAAVRVDGGGGGGPVQTISFNSDDAPPAAGMTEDGRPLSYQTTFYPSSPVAARSTVISVNGGEERLNVDFQLKPIKTMKVTGQVTGPDGPAQGLSVTLVPVEADELVSNIETATANTDGGGNFTFAAVPPGQYTLRTTRAGQLLFVNGDAITITQGAGGAVGFSRSVTTTGPPPPPVPAPVVADSSTMWAEMTLTIGNTDMTNVNMALQPGRRVSGQVNFTGTAEKPARDQMSTISIALEPVSGRPGSAPTRARLDANGAFSIPGVIPGKYFVRVSGEPKGWSFRGAMLGARDVSDLSLEVESADATGIMITYTDRPTEVRGNVQAPSGGDADATVVVFPTEPAEWMGYGANPRRIKSTRASKDGSFSIANLPPGSYFAAAVAEETAADWQDPKFLEAIARTATRLQLNEGDKPTLSLRPSRLQR